MAKLKQNLHLSTESANRNIKKRTVKNGAPTNDLVLSSYQEGNEAVFPKILDLYVQPGARIADVTYGKGVFWKNVPKTKYTMLASDISTGTDCRDLPYANDELDCVVLDPPYMHTPGGTAHVGHQHFESYYKNNAASPNGAKYHEAVIELYVDGAKEAFRTLKTGGVFVVKCQDEICSNRQRFTHVEIMNACAEIGFIAEDLFVVTRTNRPGVSRMIRQVHARKNHSYFLVFWKAKNQRQIWKRGDC